MTTETPNDGQQPPRTSAPPWKPAKPKIVVKPDADAVARAAAERFADAAIRAVDRHDRFIVALAGGTTPRAMYELLAQKEYARLPWSKTYFAFGDERCVAPDDEASNHRMAREALLDPLEIPETRVLRMKGEQAPLEAARRYEVRLGDLFLNEPKRQFDLVLLGIGTDGHTASLFPGTAALAEEERWCAANQLVDRDEWRLTLTFRALNAARQVLFLATGEAKARVIAEAFGGVPHAEPYPCERVTARRELLLDEAAASAMPSRSPAATAGDKKA